MLPGHGAGGFCGHGVQAATGVATASEMVWLSIPPACAVKHSHPGFAPITSPFPR